MCKLHIQQAGNGSKQGGGKDRIQHWMGAEEWELILQKTYLIMSLIRVGLSYNLFGRCSPQICPAIIGLQLNYDPYYMIN